MKRLASLAALLLACQLLSPPAGARPDDDRGKPIADKVFTVADDFIVDVYHNGTKVPDEKRALLVEVHGATAERLDLKVREGDWLVFNVVNNRLRWGGASYFSVVGKGELGVAFTSELTSGRWSCCDDPAEVARFIADPKHLADRRPLPIDKPWDGGHGLMNHIADGWDGTPLWGHSRNTWIKFVAR
jgi:hypothetical protein